MFRLGQREQGLARLFDAKEKFEVMLSEGPDNPKSQYSVAHAWFSLGLAHHELGQHELAVTEFESAIDVYDELHRGDRTNPRYLKSLSNGRTNLGLVFLAMGQAKRSLVEYEAALTIQDQLKAMGFENLTFKLESVKTSLAMANLQSRTKHPDAKKSYQMVIEQAKALTEKYPSLPVNFVTLARGPSEPRTAVDV